MKLLRKFDENVKLLVERMNEQVKSRRMYYAKELHAIEESYIKERQELLDKYNREWSDKLDERRFKEVMTTGRLALQRKKFLIGLLHVVGRIRSSTFWASWNVRTGITAITNKAGGRIQCNESETGKSNSRATTKDRGDESDLPVESREVRIQLQSLEETRRGKRADHQCPKES